jgi:putative membrane protein
MNSADSITDTLPENPPKAAGNPEQDPRVLFAAERTLLAWIRTGLALMGFGFVVARFGLFLRQIAAARVVAGMAQSGQTEDNMAVILPGQTTSPGFSLWLGITLVILGVVVNLVSVRQHFIVMQRLNRGESLFPAPVSTGVYIAGLLGILGIVIATYLFIVSS